MKVWFPAVRAGSGADVHVQRLSVALRQRGVEAEVTWLPRWTEIAPALARATPPPGTSLIHANSWYAYAFARFGYPVVTTVHSPIHDPQARRYKSALQRIYHDVRVRPSEARSLAAARAVVAVSAAVARSVRQVFPGVVPIVIHNWVDTAVFQPAPEPLPQAPGEPFRLLFAGNRNRWKGWDLLPELMSRLGEGFRLVVAAGLRGDVPASSLPPRSVSLGPLTGATQMVRAYQSCDAVLVPSRLEGFGYVAAEAMACGKPVVGFRSSALPELVDEGRTGLLVPTDDIGALAVACRELAADPARVAAMGQAARALAVARFSEAPAIERYVRLYGAVTA